jgi:hypothetical protein
MLGPNPCTVHCKDIPETPLDFWHSVHTARVPKLFEKHLVLVSDFSTVLFLSAFFQFEGIDIFCTFCIRKFFAPTQLAHCKDVFSRLFMPSEPLFKLKKIQRCYS